MASIAAVYRTVKDLVNKENHGFITPTVFNNFAQIAQVKIFNRLFDELKNAKRINRQSFDPGRDKSKFKQIQEDLSVFSTLATQDKTTNDIFEKPGDLARIISMTTDNPIISNQSYRKNIEIVYDEEKIERILLSDISAPSEDFPVALVSDDIEVFPSTIDTIRIRYYKYPQSLNADGSRYDGPPALAFYTNGLLDAVNNKDFELPDHYIDDLVVEIAEMAGVNLRDQFVSQFSTQEQIQKSQQ